MCAIISLTLHRAASPIMASASSRVVAIGFSRRMCFPARAASTTASRCRFSGLATTTAWMSFRARSDLWSGNTSRGSGSAGKPRSFFDGRIAHSDDARIGQLRQGASMEHAHESGADDSDSNPFAHGDLLPLQDAAGEPIIPRNGGISQNGSAGLRGRNDPHARARTHCERIHVALSRHAPGKVPLDFWMTPEVEAERMRQGSR